MEEIIKTQQQYESLKVKATGKVKDCQVKESKINAGKESIFSKITKQTKEEQLAENNKETELAKNQENMYTILSNTITCLLGNREIERFKHLRQKAYYQMLRSFAECQKSTAMAEH